MTKNRSASFYDKKRGRTNWATIASVNSLAAPYGYWTSDSGQSQVPKPTLLSTNDLIQRRVKLHFHPFLPQTL